ncbi:MAG: TonB-dependent receptor plug domain-containing protein, partial [bacterium]
MMWRTGFTGVLALLFATTPALAQTGTITGKVTAVDGGQPIANAQVSVVGTTAGALTRDDGRFTIAVRPGTYSVRAARIGYAPDSVRNISVTTGSATTADITLRANVLNLSNVLVVGYGTEEARDKTGSIETVSAKDFNTGRVVSPEQLIEAKVPGVQVVDNNEPGGGISVRIRGGASVTSSNEPLFVVDGVPLAVGGGISAQRNPGSMSPDDVGRNPLNFLNPDDIETMTVLKDASATAIYGSRGANGVVMITTKSGLGRSGVTYTTSVSNSRVTGGPSLLDAAQFRAAVTKYAPENSAMLGSANTDWRKAVQRDAMGQDHSLAFSGNRSDMNYR